MHFNRGPDEIQGDAENIFDAMSGRGGGGGGEGSKLLLALRGMQMFNISFL